MTESVHGLPLLLSVGMRVAVVPPLLKEGRWHVVTSCSQEGGTGQLVGLSGADDISAAKALAGRVLLACVDDLPKGWNLHDVDALLGREVVDQLHGMRGQIDEVLTGPANDVWGVALTDGTSLFEYLLPVIEGVVGTVPLCGPIPICIPDGLEPMRTEKGVFTGQPSMPGPSGNLGMA